MSSKITTLFLLILIAGAVAVFTGVVTIEEGSRLNVRPGVLFGDTYTKFVRDSTCSTTLHYSIGQFDPQFNLTKEAFLETVIEAEAIWEEVIGNNLFEYDPEAEFTINLLYNENQVEVLTRARENAALQARGAELRNQFQSQERDAALYERAVVAFEARQKAYQAELVAFNREVAKWNARGGAPSGVFEELEAKRRKLDATALSLETEFNNLNREREELNANVDRYNDLVQSYNQEISTFEAQFSDELEYGLFTYSPAKGAKIDILVVDSQDELEITLAHEFGHALGLGHTSDPNSLMSPLTIIDTALLGEGDIELLAERCFELGV